MCGKWSFEYGKFIPLKIFFSHHSLWQKEQMWFHFDIVLLCIPIFMPFPSQSYIFALFTMCPPVLSPVCFSFCCMYFFFSHELHSYHLIVLFFLIQTAKGLTNDILIYLNFTRWKLNLWRKMKTRRKTKWGHKMELLFLIIIVFFQLFFKE